ncbi:hypothetical protein [Nocardia concava]|uniref:hypothetical protein n=1 Tax=Nocardia concava TaxID=257281 RepID=UPI00030D7C54|nr:hypothetical protein [Nocardia concava]
MTPSREYELSTAALDPPLFGVFVTRPVFDGSLADADYITRFIDDIELPALHHSACR